MNMHNFSGLFLGAILAVSPCLALAQDLCFRSGSTIIGDPVEISVVWPIDAGAPPDLIARPDRNNLDALFGDLNWDESSAGCDGGGIVGNLNCKVVAPMLDMDSGTDPNQDRTADAHGIGPGATEESAAEADKAASNKPDLSSELGAHIQVRPVYYMTSPPTMGFQHTGFRAGMDPDKLAPKSIARADKDLKAYIAKLTKTQHRLSQIDTAQLANGENISPLAAFAFELSPNARLQPLTTIGLPPACVALFALRMTQAEQAVELDAANRSLKRLEKAKKDYENLPFLERMKDSRSLEKFDTQIKIAKNRLRKAAEVYGSTRKRINAQDQALNDAEHLAKLNAIGTDPGLIKAADMERTGRAVEAYRDYRLHEKQHAATVEEYRKGLKGYDEKIANAPDESTRIGYQEQKDRFQRAYDSWSEQSRMMTGSRFRDLAREFKQNDEDGLGPKSFEELTQRIDATGDKPEDVLENYMAEKLSRAKRIAQSDAKTLGGSASRASGSGQFIKDAASAYAEEARKAHLSPGELVEGMKKVATDDETAFVDQRQFLERFGNYARGAAKGSANGIYDTVGLAFDAATLSMEDGEAKAEKLLSAVAGKDVKIDYFGDRKTKAFDKALVGATSAVYDLYTKKGINDPDATTQLKAADVWDNPAGLDEYLIQRSQALNRTVAGGTNAVVDIADNELARVTRGGEKALRKSLETIGSTVGELADVGTLATVEGAMVASKLSKAANKLDNVADAARAAENIVDVAKADVLSDAARTQRLEAFDAPGLNPARTSRSGETLPPPAKTELLPQPLKTEPLPAPEKGQLLAESAKTEPLPQWMTAKTETLPSPSSAARADAARAAPGQLNPGAADNGLPALAEPGPLPGPAFASPVKANQDLREAKTFIEPAELSPADKWDLGPDERFNQQLISDFSSESFPRSGTIFDTNLEPATHHLAPGTEIVLNDGRKLVLGEQLGQGGFKRVYDVPGNPKLVDKAISYPAAEFPANPRHSVDANLVDEIAYDSEVGRTILQQVERGAGDGLFSVTKRHGKPILVDDPFNPKTKVLITREENIATPVEFIAPDGSRQTKIVTSAEERFALRANPQATEAEQMTIQLTMRRLNNEGVVWTDNKLKNFDVVPDKKSLTGHRMVFFDHDAVRIAPGATAAERAENARKSQLIMDSLEGRSPHEAHMRMSEIGLDDFNQNVFGKPMPLLATPKVNLRRTEFQRLNNLSKAEFETALGEFGRKIGKEIPLLSAKPN